MSSSDSASVRQYDLLVVGGGVNGAGIARDAAGRGLSVLLCEKDDLASHTSSASTKLIHGGLRYLEHYEFNLVRKALLERETLLQSAPHIMWPLRFVMPHDEAQRPAWMIRSGLFLYDHLARRRVLPGSNGIRLAHHPAGLPLKKEFTKAFEYSDGWVSDARLVVLCALDAAERGATVMTRTRCTAVQRHADHWEATLQTSDGASHRVHARAMVNAAGPWASQFLSSVAHQAGTHHLRLIKGSHIVVPRLFEHPYAYIFQNIDKRIIFAIPYEQDFTLIGTTDVDYRADIDEVAIGADEIEYLCTAVNRYFTQSIGPSDVVWTYSGVRPLLEDASTKAAEVTRDYRLALDRSGGAPLMSVFGGKITTFRKLAEEAVAQLAPLLGSNAPDWTHAACLPGGDVQGEVPSSRAVTGFDAYIREMQSQYSWLPPKLVARYARSYGTRTHQLLLNRTGIADMGEEVASGLYAAELEYLVRHEWARTAADILWRRSKMGLRLPAGTEAVVDAWLVQKGLVPTRT
jgi:glycerol-3-phosphate dehydrogenase